MMPRFGVCFIIINVIITRRNNIMALLIITVMIIVIIGWGLKSSLLAMPFNFNSKLELFGEVWWVTTNCNY